MPLSGTRKSPSTSLTADKLHSTKKGKLKRISFNFDCMDSQNLKMLNMVFFPFAANNYPG